MAVAIYCPAPLTIGDIRYHTNAAGVVPRIRAAHTHCDRPDRLANLPFEFLEGLGREIQILVWSKFRPESFGVRARAATSFMASVQRGRGLVIIKT